VDTTAVASLDEQLHIGIHERHGHGDVGAVGKDKVGVLAELLDEGEDVIPAAAVETGAVVTQFIDNLIHLKSSSDGLNQNSSTDGPPGHANVVLSEVEDVIPESGLEVGLHLGEVEVRTVAASNQLLGVVEEVETKIEQAAGDRLALNSEVLLVKVPASSTSDQGGKGTVCAELVLFVSLLEVDLTADSIIQVDLAGDHVRPGRGTRVLEIRHISPDIRIQSIDDHLAVRGTSNLHTTVNQTGSGRSTLPGVIFTNVLGLGEEVRQMALVNLGLAIDTALQEGFPGRVEGAVEDSEESAGFLGEDLAMLVVHGAQDGDILKLYFHLAHVDIVFCNDQWLRMM
jgi:hypothetical protein